MGISVAPKTRSKIMPRKGQKQVGALVSAEREQLFSRNLLKCRESYLSIMLVFPRNKMTPELMLNATPGSWGICTDSSWTRGHRFLEWFEQFVKLSGPSVDRTVVVFWMNTRAYPKYRTIKSN